MAWRIEHRQGRATLHLPKQTIKLGRVLSAVCWPAGEPGAYLAGAQDLGGRLYLVREAVSDDWQELARLLAQDQSKLRPEVILHDGSPAGEAYAQRAVEPARQQYGLDEGLPFCAAPYADLPQYSADIARAWIAGKRVSILPDLKGLLGQIKRASGMQPAEVAAGLEQMPLYRAFAFLLSACDAWPFKAPSPGALEYQAADERTGI